MSKFEFKRVYKIDNKDNVENRLDTYAKNESFFISTPKYSLMKLKKSKDGFFFKTYTAYRGESIYGVELTDCEIIITCKLIEHFWYWFWFAIWGIVDIILMVLLFMDGFAISKLVFGLCFIFLAMFPSYIGIRRGFYLINRFVKNKILDTQ